MPGKSPIEISSIRQAELVNDVSDAHITVGQEPGGFFKTKNLSIFFQAHASVAFDDAVQVILIIA